MKHVPNVEKAAEHFRKCMVELGLNPEYDEALSETPERVVSFLLDATTNYRSKPTITCAKVYNRETHLKLTTFPADEVDQLIFEGGMAFSSICAHHFLPFFGTAHIGYIPGKRMLGLSKLPRIVDFFAKAPNTQEYMTSEILGYIREMIEPNFVMVMLRAEHTCVSCRGPRKSTAYTITSKLWSVYPQDAQETTKREFLSYLTIP